MNLIKSVMCYNIFLRLWQKCMINCNATWPHMLKEFSSMLQWSRNKGQESKISSKIVKPSGFRFQFNKCAKIAISVVYKGFKISFYEVLISIFVYFVWNKKKTNVSQYAIHHTSYIITNMRFIYFWRNLKYTGESHKRLR